MSTTFPLLFPLDRFYSRHHIALPNAELVTAEAVPQPYRALLCGEHDMTPTLEAFHKDRIHLRVLERWQEGHWRVHSATAVERPFHTKREEIRRRVERTPGCPRL